MQAAHLHLPEAVDGPDIGVMSEIPERVRQPMSKSALEVHDVRAFLLDAASDPADFSIEAGPESNLPPDCYVTFGESEKSAYEAAQLVWPAPNASQNLLGRGAMFETSRSYLLAQARELAPTMSQHSGKMIWLWFDANNRRLPPGSIKAKESLVQHLQTSTPPPLQDSDDVSAEVEVIVSNVDSSINSTWAMLPYNWSSEFADVFGFDIALAYHEHYTRPTVLAGLADVVRGHDAPVNDVLVLTVNAPTRSGIWYPSESLHADMLFEDPDPLRGYTPQHVGNIVIHDQGGHRYRWIVGGPRVASPSVPS
jgi:hypothetical protein